jgi:predicted secreted Zn-dependent protease
MRCRSLLASGLSACIAPWLLACAQLHQGPSDDLVANAIVTKVGAVNVRRELRYYDLHSTRLSEIPAEVRGLRARNAVPQFYGATKWGISLVRSGKGVQTSCTASRLRADVSIITLMPRAVNVGRFTPSERERWGEFVEALAQHEQRHDSIAIAEAQSGLEALSLRSIDGESQPRGIRECTMTLLAGIRREHEALDALTGHGRTDGAVLRVRGLNGMDWANFRFTWVTGPHVMMFGVCRSAGTVNEGTSATIGITRTGISH